MPSPQTVDSHLRLQARAPRIPVARLAATRPASTRRPMAPLLASRYEPQAPRPVPHAPEPPQLYPRYEAAEIGAKRNPLPRYMFRPQRQAFVTQIQIK